MTSPAARTQGIHHAGLTVPDLAATRTFFEEVLGFEARGEKPDYPAVFLSDGSVMITLWQAALLRLMTFWSSSVATATP